MVLESIVVPSSWEKHPKRMLLIGFLYSTIGLILGYSVFGGYASLSAIFLTTIPLVVIMYQAFFEEEEKDLKICKEILLLKEHTHLFLFFLYLFLGMVFSYTLWFTMLPPHATQVLFSYQTEIIDSIPHARAAGAATSQMRDVWIILSNNLMVLGFCILFSLLYGSGAIFILTMNASIIGVAIGSLINSGIRMLAKMGHSNFALNYFTVLPLGMTYLVHGIPEILSYFIGALGGGIISVAMVCHHYTSPKFRQVVLDALTLTAISVIILVLAALIEVYVTPNLLT
jgi:uncharacterized membrane protein SpoIIM required for sporulation